MHWARTLQDYGLKSECRWQTSVYMLVTYPADSRRRWTEDEQARWTGTRPRCHLWHCRDIGSILSASRAINCHPL